MGFTMHLRSPGSGEVFKTKVETMIKCKQLHDFEC